MTNSSDPTVIVGTARTPMGGMNGGLSSVSAPHLGIDAIHAAVERSGVPPHDINEVIMGTVLPAGQQGAPARQAALGAGIPASAGCTTINKMCSSGMKSAMLADCIIQMGGPSIHVAGGMESMSNAPYLVLKGRSGYRLGHGELKDHMFYDALEDPTHEGKLMGSFAEDSAETYQFTREMQDDYAVRSLERAQKAVKEGFFEKEIIPVRVRKGRKEVLVEIDEQPLAPTATPEKIRALGPAFRKEGTITAANASSISDGASALVLMRRSEADKRGIAPLATVVGHSTFSQVPELFTTSPVFAIRDLMANIGWTTKDVDLWEINEAFAAVAMIAMHDHHLSHDNVNVHGGACALGHPVGSSGCRIIVTLIHALEKYGLKRGIAALCAAGGEATAFAVERP
uniref:Acetyl-CoA C-acetyltransferase n=1 Tax=Candidatus Kentrum eta TaxID=2126337 RepID=A0A450UB57_9GAMM|nr:MAG: acetyl-CoA C-acetyltransferase [Candidatus Kentron sp. H]VFJ91143.1 MAG: acetyl-CoA C-acetyltransferase [Candidatus Kentron sp. H]VFJ97461.1 MAG: acetyl-CoA C-acetyltransferase [Candidatus Kentron sp. H]